MKKLKLYVWEDVLTEYSPGIMFALAENVEEAREMILADESEATLSDTACAKKDLKKKYSVYEQPFGRAFWGGA